MSCCFFSELFVNPPPSRPHIVLVSWFEGEVGALWVVPGASKGCRWMVNVLYLPWKLNIGIFFCRGGLSQREKERGLASTSH